MTKITPTLVLPTAFSGLRYYLFVALVFLDIGIFFGGLNALRVAEVLNVPEIHQTHWTSTLFGSMTVIMMGILLYMISLSINIPKQMRQATYVVLVLILLGIFSSYIQTWFPGNVLGRFFVEFIKAASILYLLIVTYLTFSSERYYELKEEPAYIMIYSAIIWMGISQLFFFGYRGLIGPYFMISYVYGFFSLSLFGTLSFVLPRMLELKSRSKFSVVRDTFMISLSATFLLLGEYFDNLGTLLGLLGTVSWGLVGFMFILYVFDLMFKTGITNKLTALAIALVMFGFFVFDTLMKIVFPIWVNSSHAHFMFLGTLVITIISIGILFIEKQEMITTFPETFQNLVIGTVVLGVSLILFGFTLQLLLISGYTGIILSICLICFELYTIIKLK